MKTIEYTADTNFYPSSAKLDTTSRNYFSVILTTGSGQLSFGSGARVPLVLGETYKPVGDGQSNLLNTYVSLRLAEEATPILLADAHNP